jgi:hypothetical protein
VSEPALFGKTAGRQAEHLGLDALGIDVVVLAVVLPEAAVSVASGSITTRNFSFERRR